MYTQRKPSGDKPPELPSVVASISAWIHRQKYALDICVAHQQNSNITEYLAHGKKHAYLFTVMKSFFHLLYTGRPGGHVLAHAHERPPGSISCHGHLSHPDGCFPGVTDLFIDN